MDEIQNITDDNRDASADETIKGCFDLRNPKSFLIVGAGGGQELSTFIPPFPHAQYVAVDPSDNMLHLAKLRLKEEQLHATIDYYA